MQESGKAKFQNWIADGTLIHPVHNEYSSLIHLIRAIQTILGLSPNPTTESSQLKIQKLVDTIGPDTQHIVLVLSDGMGTNLIQKLPENHFFRTNFKHSLTTVFPSETAPAITSLSTGVWPAEHNIIGWFQYLPKYNLQSKILPFLERFEGGDLGQLGVDPNVAFPYEAWMPKVGGLCLVPENLAGSVYTNYLSGGNNYGYSSFEDATTAIVNHISQHSHTKTYTYFYIPDVDHTEHRYGIDAPAVMDVVEKVSETVRNLSIKLGKIPGNQKFRVVVTADHGQINVDKEASYVFPTLKNELFEYLEQVPHTTVRVPFFHVKPEKKSEFIEFFRQRFIGFELLTLDEVEELRLLGDVDTLPEETRKRLGDFMAISDGKGVFYHLPETQRFYLGNHGGLLPDEVFIPFILVKINDFIKSNI